MTTTPNTEEQLPERPPAPEKDPPPQFVLLASDPLALDVLHYYLNQYRANKPDMRELARLHSTAATFARWLTPVEPIT